MDIWTKIFDIQKRKWLEILSASFHRLYCAMQNLPTSHISSPKLCIADSSVALSDTLLSMHHGAIFDAVGTCIAIDRRHTMAGQ